MATKCSPQCLLIIILACLLLSCNVQAYFHHRETYIVYMGDRLKGGVPASSLHSSILQEVMGSDAKESLVYSYGKSFNGFVAKLTVEERNKIGVMEGVVSVFPDEKLQLHTTRSWDFVGFPQQAQRAFGESDVIIGMFDTGIWPESASFSDKGFGPPPKKWKGSCQSSANFTCNNKIIGAKYYRSSGSIVPGEFASPRDSLGHGTHTSSTAAGDVVQNASMIGLGSGTARGAVPSARLAVYKVCWSDGCSFSDILAAFDDAISDGVDIISLSLGGFFPRDYFVDPIAIGAFHAMKNGILVSNSAGNSGPGPRTISNFSPWSLSVGASTIDRKFVTDVKLGNNKVYQGVSVNSYDYEDEAFPLVYAGDVPNKNAGYTGSTSRFCGPDSLDSELVNGTIVLCDARNNAESAATAGAVGTIMHDSNFHDFAFAFPIAATYLYPGNGSATLTYINSTSKPTATIHKSYTVDDVLAPYVVSFSSRGPNPITADIIKPDITAPGVDILAAWTEANTVTGLFGDTRIVKYNIISGTSMSCPHATGTAAYVKSFNPTWSPAAIKSALMTTATPMSTITNTDGEFAYGSGQIDPSKAAKPGLIYDLSEADYVNLLCGQGYSSKNVQLITGDNSTCTDSNVNSTVWDLNYPSFAVSVALPISPVTRTFHRTVTNVGSAVSTYKATVIAPKGLDVVVEPSVLTFRSIGQKQSFVVKVTAEIETGRLLSGALVWDDGTYKVRSPIAAYKVNFS